MRLTGTRARVVASRSARSPASCSPSPPPRPRAPGWTPHRGRRLPGACGDQRRGVGADRGVSRRRCGEVQADHLPVLQPDQRDPESSRASCSRCAAWSGRSPLHDLPAPAASRRRGRGIRPGRRCCCGVEGRIPTTATVADVGLVVGQRSGSGRSSPSIRISATSGAACRQVDKTSRTLNGRRFGGERPDLLLEVEVDRPARRTRRPQEHAGAVALRRATLFSTCGLVATSRCRVAEITQPVPPQPCRVEELHRPTDLTNGSTPLSWVSCRREVDQRLQLHQVVASSAGADRPAARWLSAPAA